MAAKSFSVMGVKTFSRRGLWILFTVWITASMNRRFSRLRIRYQELLLRIDFCFSVVRNFLPPCFIRFVMLSVWADVVWFLVGVFMWFGFLLGLFVGVGVFVGLWFWFLRVGVVLG